MNFTDRSLIPIFLVFTTGVENTELPMRLPTRIIEPLCQTLFFLKFYERVLNKGVIVRPPPSNSHENSSLDLSLALLLFYGS